MRKRCKLDNARSAATRPIIGMITRLTHQKGFDLLMPVIPKIIEEGAQLVLLGSGDKELEAQLQAIAAAMPESVSVTLGYDEELSHQIEAEWDIFLMPSRFEP
ncbi:MAG: glycosyltransferase [Thiotrichaceae bacterium]